MCRAYLRLIALLSLVLAGVSPSATAQVGDETFANNLPLVGVFEPSAARLKDGKFVIVWTQRTGYDAIWFRLVDNNGVPQGESETLVSQPNLFQYGQAAQVAALSDGGFVVAWRSGGTIGPQGVAARYYDATGTPKGDEVAVSPSGGWVNAAIGLSSGFNVILWRDDYGTLKARMLDNSGRPGGSEYTVAHSIKRATARSVRAPWFYDSNGEYYIAYTTSNSPGFDALYTTKYRHKIAIAFPRLINWDSSGQISSISIARQPGTGAGSSAIVVWSALPNDSFYSDPSTIFAKRIDGSASSLFSAFTVATLPYGQSSSATDLGDRGLIVARGTSPYVVPQTLNAKVFLDLAETPTVEYDASGGRQISDHQVEDLGDGRFVAVYSTSHNAYYPERVAFRIVKTPYTTVKYHKGHHVSTLSSSEVSDLLWYRDMASNAYNDIPIYNRCSRYPSVTVIKVPVQRPDDICGEGVMPPARVGAVFCGPYGNLPSGDPRPNTFTLSFRGTDGPLDLVDDIAQLALTEGAEDTESYIWAKDILTHYQLCLQRRFRSNYRLILTGHSLGGGMAQWAAATAVAPVRKVVTFNSAGLSRGSLASLSQMNTGTTAFDHVIASGDPVSKVGWHFAGRVIHVDSTLSTRCLPPVLSPAEAIARLPICGFFWKRNHKLETIRKLILDQRQQPLTLTRRGP